MSTKLTRASFISSDIDKVAISKETMYVVEENGESVVEVPIPESIKITGIVPEGYSVDYHLDPSVVVNSLAKIDITTIEQLPGNLFAELKAQVNAPNNVTIAPSFVVEEKRETIENALRKVTKDE